MTRARHPLPALFAAALLVGCAPQHATSVKQGTIKEVLDAHTDEMMKLPGVIGTGEGLEGSERAFVVFVSRRTPELDRALPQRIGGYPVIVRVVGNVSAPPK